MHTTSSDSPQPVPLRVWIGVLGALVGAFMAILDIQIVNAALKDIQGTLGASLEEGSWISTSYLVAEIIIIPLTGWLSGIFSLRRYLLVNAGLFVLFSLCCAFANDLPTMACLRALQGLTGGTLIPIALTVVITQLPRATQPIGLALFGLVATFAPAAGPVVGGWLTDNFGWQYIFLVNVIPGILLIVACAYGIPRSPPIYSELKQGDWVGIAAMAMGLGCVTIVLEEGNRKDWFASSLIVQLSAVGLASLLIFVALQWVGKRPFINLRLLLRRNFALCGLVNLTLGVATYGTIYLLPLYLGQIQAYNALQIGQVMVWAGLPQLVLAPLLPVLMRRFDARLLIALGVGLYATSCFINSSLTHDTAADQLVGTQILQALAQPLLYIPLSSVATMDIELEQAGSASGLFNMIRNLGGSIGIALLATFLTRREQFHASHLVESLISSKVLQERLDNVTGAFVHYGTDPVTAAQQSVAAFYQTIHREAFVLAYADCFFIIGLAFVVSLGAVVCLKRSAPSAPTGAIH